MLLAKFVAEEAGGFGGIVDERGGFWTRVGGMMVNDDPVRLVHARFKGEIGDPAGLFTQFTLFPVVIVVRFQRHILAEKLFGEPLQQGAGNEPIQVAFVRDDDFRLWQLRHVVRIMKGRPRGERGIFKLHRGAQAGASA